MKIPAITISLSLRAGGGYSSLRHETDFNGGGAAHSRASQGLWGRSLKVASAVAAVAAAALLATACGGKPQHSTEAGGGAPIPVRVETAAPQAWARQIDLTAGVFPWRRAMPGTVLMGRVDQVLHKEGDRVKGGELLARVESREVSARLAQAEANVTAAQAMEENALRMKERMERLNEKQAASRKNLEDATAGYEGAAANLKAAEEGVKAARMYVSYADVTAPFDGTIVEKRVEAGDTAAPGMPLFTIEDNSKVKIEASVPESLAPGLTPGGPVEIDIAAAGVAGRAAAIAEILPDADPRSRTVTIRIVLDNPGGAIRSGMFARVRIPAGTGPEAGSMGGHRSSPGSAATAIAVPDSAIVRQGPLTGLYVVDESGVARLRWVTSGQSREGRSEILSGLLSGERVVVEPPAELEDGRRVEVR